MGLLRWISKKILCIGGAAIVVAGCGGVQEQAGNGERELSADTARAPFEIQYAKNFDVEFRDGYKKVTVSNPWKNAEREFTYLLVQKGTKAPSAIKADEIVHIPLDDIVCFSTTHIPLLVYLGEGDALTGFPTTDYISSPRIRARIDAGKVKDLGPEADINVEELINLNPDVAMAYGSAGQSNKLEKVRRTGIPVVLNADYMENTPLGRSEWIKFVSLFFNKETMADSIFSEIRHAYDSLLKIGAAADDRPTVFSGVVYGDTWFMPGGANYAGQFFEDAGASYLWQDSDERGYIEISFEAVYERAHRADYWVGVGSYETLEELAGADDRYRAFEAFKKGNVYNYNASMGAAGGNEYFELGYLRPDLILADLIKIFHEGELPGYKLYFHKKLK